MQKTKLLSALLILLPCLLSAQQAGKGTYGFLNLVTSPRIAAMGGNFLAIDDNDISLSLSNPSLISKDMAQSLSLNFVDYYTDINYGTVMYAGYAEKLGTYVTSLQYIDYGTFTRTDATGAELGSFSAGEFAANLGWGRRLDSSFSIGANLKAIYSSLDDYNSFGLGVDVAGSYYQPEKQLTVSLIARNAGRQIKSYRSGNTEALPFELMLGVSKRLKHMPFRYSILYTHLEKFDLTYTDALEDAQNVDPLTNEPLKKDKVSDFADKLARHFVIGGEFIPSRNFSVRLGYNYKRRQEMGVDTRMSTVGFSWGFGLRISRFQFNYARSTYHLAGSPNYISITTRL